MKPIQPIERVAMPMVVALALSALATSTAAAERRAEATRAGRSSSVGVARPASGKSGWDLEDLGMTGHAARPARIDTSPGRRARWGFIEGLLASGARSGW
jgi:hypothetical protein